MRALIAELPKIEVNQKDASQVNIVTSMFKPNKMFKDMIVAMGPPTTIAITIKAKISTCIINPTKF